MRRALLLTAALVAALSQSGCVDRFLAIHSDPPGAVVYVDGEKVGTTPCEITYVWYGTRLVVLELRGYSLVRQEVTLSPPWWQIIPLDLITDVVIPFTIRDRMSVSYTLEPAPLSPEEVNDVQDRADELRKKSTAPAPKE
jgi:hypothetical protein